MNLTDSHHESGHGAVVDASGHRCPMPLLMAKRALNGLQAGQTLALTATDPGSLRDFEVFSRQSGHELLQAEQAGEAFHFVLRKAPPSC